MSLLPVDIHYTVYKYNLVINKYIKTKVVGHNSLIHFLDKQAIYRKKQAIYEKKTFLGTRLTRITIKFRLIYSSSSLARVSSHILFHQTKKMRKTKDINLSGKLFEEPDRNNLKSQRIIVILSGQLILSHLKQVS